jgi:DNA-binding response OmpR family regulator
MSANPHIVVVDDEAAARDMVGDYLRMHGFQVSLCDGGGSLRRTLKQGTPDLIVLDLNMPEEDGLSVIRDLRARSHVPVIMLTATASPIDRIVGLELGADDYLPKPCELRELLARIRSILRRAAAPAPVEAEAAPRPPASASAPSGSTVEAHCLRDDEGAEQVLSRSEFDL